MFCFCTIGIRKWSIKWPIGIVGEEHWEIIGLPGTYSIPRCKASDPLKFLMSEVQILCVFLVEGIIYLGGMWGAVTEWVMLTILELMCISHATLLIWLRISWVLSSWTAKKKPPRLTILKLIWWWIINNWSASILESWPCLYNNLQYLISIQHEYIQYVRNYYS